MLSWALSWFSTFKPSATHCKETIQNEPKPRIKVISKMEMKGRYTLTPEQLLAFTLTPMHQSINSCPEKLEL
jgi:hypothetical protein